MPKVFYRGSSMFKLLIKVLLGLILAGVVVVVAALLGRNIIVARVTAHTVKRMTGFRASVGSADLRLREASLYMHELVIQNPGGEFKDQRCMRIKTFQADCEVGSLW